MTTHTWDTPEYRTKNYNRTVELAATEVRVRNIVGTGSATRNEELGKRVTDAATNAGIDPRTAARAWVAAINTPQPEDKQIAELKTRWDAIQHEPDTIGWYNKWFCENANDFGVEYTHSFYANCLAQYEEWMAESVGAEWMLDSCREQYIQMERESCDPCNVYQEAARIAGHRMFAEDVPDSEHAKHVMAELIAAVRAHADQHYNDTESGWHIVVEDWNDTDLTQKIGDATTPEAAIARIGQVVREEFAIWQQG